MLVGKAGLNIIRAKDLIKMYLVKKSDPYAVMKHGNQQNKISVVKNCWNTERNYEVDIEIPDGNDRILSFEVFDLDKVGIDKSSGKLVPGQHFLQLQKPITHLIRLVHWVIGNERVTTTSEQNPLHDVTEIIQEDYLRKSRTRTIKKNLAEIIEHRTDLKKTIMITHKEFKHALFKSELLQRVLSGPLVWSKITD